MSHVRGFGLSRGLHLGIEASSSDGALATGHTALGHQEQQVSYMFFIVFVVQVGELRSQHQSELLAQIAANEEKRQLERAAVQEAGRQAAKKSAEYVSKIERIKQKKLKELEEAGVPAKYCAECAFHTLLSAESACCQRACCCCMFQDTLVTRSISVLWVRKTPSIDWY